MVNIRVFSKLTLTPEDVESILPSAQTFPPIQKGDLTIASHDEVNIAVIIDGRFYQSQAISSAEILDALRRGMKIYGSSSMGALRAAECHPWGMIGHGSIYEWIVGAGCFRDDFVGQAVDPDTLDALSRPQVELAAHLHALRGSERIDEHEAQLADDILAREHYSSRTRPALARGLRQRGVTHERASELAAMVFAAPSIKREDAEGLLSLVAADLADIEADNATLECHQQSAPDAAAFYP